MTCAQRSRSGSQPSTPCEVEDDVEAPLQIPGEVVESLSTNVAVTLISAASRRAASLDGRAREVDAGDRSRRAAPSDGVDPEVTLQVQQRLAPHVADERDFQLVIPVRCRAPVRS
jgi:hypothetical protein